MSMRSAVAAAISLSCLSILLAGCVTDGGSAGPVVRHTGAQRQAAIDSLTHDVPPTSLEMASGQCWMAQEKKKDVNDLDAKIADVDKCIAEKKKKYPLLTR
jgi:hypothetical protein